MQVIDVDSHITVVKGLEGTPFQIHPAAGDRIAWTERGPFSVDSPV